MAVTYTGRKSGNKYSLPVNYTRVADSLLTISLAKRTWWRNLRDGADITIRLRGKELSARAEVFEDPTAVVQGLAELVRASPRYATYLKVKRDERGQPSMVDLDIAARERVLIRTRMNL